MKRTTVFLEERVERDLRLVATRKGVPAASLVREALERFLEKETQIATRSLRFVASGRSGSRSTADRHEEILWRDLEPHGRRSSPRRRRS
jgi:predicted DNA-binding protein